MNVAITGGARGIGLATARHFAREGARVAIGDLDRAPGAAATFGGLGLELDVADRDSFAAFLAAAEERHGPLDVLVNNAGVDWIGPFHEEPDEVTRRELEVNLLGTITGTRLALRLMLPRGRVRDDRFEVWVPASQGVASRLGTLLPRRAREAVLLGLGIARLTEGTDAEARRDYHRRMFGAG